MNIREQFEDFVDGYYDTEVSDDNSPRLLKEDDVWDFVEGVYKEIEEEVFRIRYMEHDPKADCPCDICKTCERLFKFLR